MKLGVVKLVLSASFLDDFFQTPPLDLATSKFTQRLLESFMMVKWLNIKQKQA